jgi:hypothetical protein
LAQRAARRYNSENRYRAARENDVSRHRTGGNPMTSRAISIAISVGVLALAPAALAQAPARTAGAAAAYKAPRTALGQPDLQGIWTNATITPVERDAKFGDRLALTDAEVHELESGYAALVA